MPPPNTSMATALVIDALPYTNTQNLTGMTGQGGGEEYNLWYKLPASLVTGSEIIGARAVPVNFAPADPFGQVLAYVNPPVGIYGTPYLNAKSNFTSVGGRIQIPLEIPPRDYYFRMFIEDFDPLPTYDATFTCYAAPANQALSAGAILVNNDSAGFAAAVVHPTTGAILAFLPSIVHGETGDVLPNGRLLLEGPGGFNLYDAALQLLTTVALTGNVGSGNQVDTFYALTTETAQRWIRKITQDGVISTRWGPVTNDALLVAVSRNGTIAYFTNGLPNGTGDGGKVHRWDLVNDVPLSDLAPAFTSGNPFNLQQAGVTPGGILVLADHSILVNYYRSNGADSRIRRYAPDGTLLSTYDFTGPSLYTLIDRIAHDPVDDGLSFWAWSKGGGAAFGLGSFQKIRVSDGVALSTAISAEVNFGYQLRIDSNVNNQQFGHPFSCPFVLLRSAVEAECIIVPPKAACWFPHDIDNLTISRERLE